MNKNQRSFAAGLMSIPFLFSGCSVKSTPRASPKYDVAGTVIEEHFPKKGDSYVRIVDKSGNKLRLNIRTNQPTLYIGSANAAKYHGKAGELDEMIDVGDHLEASVLEERGIYRTIDTITSVRGE